MTQMTQMELQNELEKQAIGALEKLLRQMTGVRVSDIWNTHAGVDSPFGILVRAEVFGHGYTLACAVESDGDPARIRTTLSEFTQGDPRFPEDAIPVIIAPSLSPEAQKACREGSAGFIDLQGNAYLFLGESFIALRESPSRALTPAAQTPAIPTGSKAPRPTVGLRSHVAGDFAL